MYFKSYVVFSNFSDFVDSKDPKVNSIKKENVNGMLLCFESSVNIKKTLSSMKGVVERLNTYSINYWKAIIGEGGGEIYESYETIASVKNVNVIKSILIKYEVFNSISDPKEIEQLCFDPLRWICDKVFNGNLMATDTSIFKINNSKKPQQFPQSSRKVTTTDSIAIDKISSADLTEKKKKLSRFLKGFRK